GSRAGRDEGMLARYRFSAAAVAVIGVTYAGGLVLHGLREFPESWQITTGPMWATLVKWINVNFYDALEAAKTALLVNVLVPVKRFLLGLPWAWVIALVSAAGMMLGGWRLALLTGSLATFILVTGGWADAMVTVYLCGISVVIASLIGIPIGIAAAGNERAWRAVQAVIDTLQTLPSFVYLIPVVMLFRVGDFSAMIAIVAYAIAPAIRYTAHGIRQVPTELIEAGIVSGCTPR